jgi:hypothetical protein
LTLYWKNGEVATTDGPYAKTKEQLGGIIVLEARDMNHAVQLMTQHWIACLSPLIKLEGQSSVHGHKRNRTVFGKAQNDERPRPLVTREECSREFWEEVENRKAAGKLSKGSPF